MIDLNKVIKVSLFRQCFIAIIFLFLSVFPSYAQTLKLTTVDWPPFYGEDLPQKGFFSSLVREAFDRAGYSIKIEFQTWKRALESTKKGHFDGLLGAYHTEDREQYFHFSDPVFENQDVFISTNPSLVSYESLNDLKDIPIATLRGAAYSDELKAKGFKVQDTDSDLQSLKMLSKGRIHLVLISKAHFRFLIEKHSELKKIQNDLFLLEEPFRTYQLYCPLRKGLENSEEIIEQFNQGLKEIKQDGTYERLEIQFGI